MMDGQRVLAVILGRAGSRGLPGKNWRPLAGRPVIAWTMDDARTAGTVDRIIVSTDGNEIAKAARSMEIEVIRRPPELASDTATVDASARHAVEASGDHAPIIVLLYANVPVRPDGLIDRAVRMLVKTGADSVQSYCSVGKHHPYWMVTLDRDHRVQPHVANTVYRRQDLPPLFLPDGGVIALTRNALFTVIDGRPHAFLGEDRRGIILDPWETIDIDTLRDFRVAESILGSPVNAVEAL
jgi:N-acylneuraminate cytidylyltransferase